MAGVRLKLKPCLCVSVVNSLSILAQSKTNLDEKPSDHADSARGFGYTNLCDDACACFKSYGMVG
jgi:hypothetical protein